MEKKYPIYSFSAKWSQTDVDGKYGNCQPKAKDLPSGRFWNSTNFSKMYKEPQDQKSLDAWFSDWWDKFKTGEKYINEDLELLHLKVEFKAYETWHLTWFQHETFDEGQTDEEVLESFERFVSSKEDLKFSSDHEQYCLMGAEDRWRWYGGLDENSNHRPAPCRCEDCKKQGMIRIAH